MSDITLSASMRSNLLSLRNISTQMDNTQLILASGKKVNSAIDNPNNYYQASSLMNRASDLETLLQGMEQGIQVIQAANGGIEKASRYGWKSIHHCRQPQAERDGDAQISDPRRGKNRRTASDENKAESPDKFCKKLFHAHPL